MAYIGRGTDSISNVEVLDNITFSGASSYTLQKGSANYVPISAANILVSIDGVVQANNFSVNGSTIDFGVAIANTSTCNFILHYGVGLVTTVQDGAITSTKLGSSSVTSAKMASNSIATASIIDDAITYAKMQDTSAANRVLGAASAGTIGEVQVSTDMIADAQVDESKLKISNAPTNGYFLSAQSGGSGGMTWAEAGGGAWNLISTTTISNDATVLVEGLNSTYAVYAFTIHDLVPVAEGPTALQVRYKIGGSVLTDGKYDYVAQRANGAPNDTLSTGGTGNDTAEISLTYDNQVSNGAAKSFASTIFLYNPSGTAKRKMLRHFSVFHSSAGGITQVDGCGAYNNSNAAVTGLQFYVSSGNLNTGVIKLYGIT